MELLRCARSTFFVLADSTSNQTLATVAPCVSGAEIGTETRHSRTYMMSHLLDCNGKSESITEKPKRTKSSSINFKKMSMGL